jgi:hypothetical protein
VIYFILLYIKVVEHQGQSGPRLVLTLGTKTLQSHLVLSKPGNIVSATNVAFRLEIKFVSES